jgi:hypothetical protein
MKKNKKEEAIRDSRLWWEDLTEDDQIWTMINHGFENFNHKNITAEQILEIWELENP